MIDLTLDMSLVVGLGLSFDLILGKSLDRSLV
jgi:hypothetical protein